jgi:hypothetical protein
MSTPYHSTPISSSLHPETALSSPNVLDYPSKHYFLDSLENSRNSLVSLASLNFFPFLDNSPLALIPLPTILPLPQYHPHRHLIPKGSLYPKDQCYLGNPLILYHTYIVVNLAYLGNHPIP